MTGWARINQPWGNKELHEAIGESPRFANRDRIGGQCRICASLYQDSKSVVRHMVDEHESDLPPADPSKPTSNNKRVQASRLALMDFPNPLLYEKRTDRSPKNNRDGLCSDNSLHQEDALQPNSKLVNEQLRLQLEMHKQTIKDLNEKLELQKQRDDAIIGGLRRELEIHNRQNNAWDDVAQLGKLDDKEQMTQQLRKLILMMWTHLPGGNSMTCPDIHKLEGLGDEVDSESQLVLKELNQAAEEATTDTQIQKRYVVIEGELSKSDDIKIERLRWKDQMLKRPIESAEDATMFDENLHLLNDDNIDLKWWTDKILTDSNCHQRNLESFSKLIEKFDKKKKELEFVLTSRKSHCVELEKQIKEHLSVIKTLRNDNEELENELKKYKTFNENLRNEIKQFELKVKELLNENEQLQSKLRAILKCM